MAGPEWEFQTQELEPILKLAGFDVVRLADVSGVWQATYGTPDLYLRHPRSDVPSFWIEVKHPDTSHGLTEHQKMWHEKERECGGIVWTISSTSQLTRKLNDEFGIELEVR